MKKIASYFSLVLFAAVLSQICVSCGNDDEPRNEWLDPYVYIQRERYTEIPSYSVGHTPFGIIGSVEEVFYIKTNVASSHDITGDIVAICDESIKNSISFSSQKFTIKAGETCSEAITVTVSNFEFLQDIKEQYVFDFQVSFNLTQADKNVAISKLYNKLDFSVTKTPCKLIDDKGTLDGLTKLDRSAWTLTTNDDGASNLDKAFDGNNTTYVKFSRGTDIEIKIDLGAETSFKALEFYSPSYIYGFRKVTVEYSLDGVKWDSIGTLNYVTSKSLYAVLYGPVAARFVKLNGEFYYPNYPTYCRLYEFALYN
ncbi:MAG: discoidin domain-containing protein [Muribaculaceae bacterium]